MMKKNLLAASLAVALGSLSGGAAAAWSVNDQGIGHYNLVPYYTVQEGSNTLINIVNTDTDDGKIVKVRFRAAEWSDDALDFQVFLSPGDVWTAAVGVEGGVPKLVSEDKSCTLPADLGAGKAFPTTRVEGRDAEKLFEGYVEIFVMADIPRQAQTLTGGGLVYNNGGKPNPLYTASKHVAGVAPCTPTVIGSGLLAHNTLQTTSEGVNVAPADRDVTAISAADLLLPENQRTWMKPATGGLMTNVTIIKVDSSRAFAIPATAIAGDAADVSSVQYFRQSDTVLALTDTQARSVTADRLFYSAGADPLTLKNDLDATTAEKRGAAYPAYEFDMPDLSTPFVAGGNARTHRDTLAALLNNSAKAAVEYLIEPGLKATTDVVFSQPMRRYFYDYTPVATASGFNRTIPGSANAVKTFKVAGQDNSVYQGITLANLLPMTMSSFYDREEQSGTSGIVVSPSEPGDPVALKGEVSVISVKNGSVPTGSLGAKLTANNWEFAEAYTSGWATLSLAAATSLSGDPLKTAPAPEASVNLPVIGFSAINIFNAAAGAAGTNYGMINPLRKF